MAAHFADADGDQEQGELAGQVGSDPRRVDARRLGEGRRGRRNDQLGGLGQAAAGGPGQSQGGGASLPGQHDRLGRARDLARDRYSDHQVGARPGGREVAGRIAGELQGARRFGRSAGQRFEGQLGAERGVMRIAAAGHVQVLHGQAELVVERLPHRVVEHGSQLTDEPRQAVDLGDHRVHRGLCPRRAQPGSAIIRTSTWRWRGPSNSASISLCDRPSASVPPAGSRVGAQRRR